MEDQESMSVVASAFLSRFVQGPKEDQDSPVPTAYAGRYTPKGSSKVWKHFFLLRDFPSKAFCSHCCSDPMTVASGEGVMTYHEGGKSGTSSMKKHLERKHNLYLDPGPRLDPLAGPSHSPSTGEVSSPQVVSPESPPPSSHNSQLALPSNGPPRDFSQTIQAPMLDPLLKGFVRNVIIRDLKPFQVSEERGLREFLRDLHANYKHLATSSVRATFEFMHGEIMNAIPSRHLSDQESVSVNGYGFEFPVGRDEFIFGLVLSWIDNNWTENRVVCYSSGDAESDLGSMVVDTLSHHGFPSQGTELFALVSDGSAVVEASDMQATILPCSSSVLRTALDTVLDGHEAGPQVKKLMTKVRRLADYLQALQSWNISSRMILGETEGLQGIDLSFEDSERVASTCELLRSVCSKKDSIEALMARGDVFQESLHLTDEDFVTVSQLASVLDSLREAADILHCQSRVRLSLFYPVMRILQMKLDKAYPILVLGRAADGGERLEIKEDQLELPARNVRASLRAYLRQCLSSLNEHQVSVMSVAAALDPRFKALRFLTMEERDVVWTTLLHMLRQKEDVKPSLALEPLTKRSKLASFFGDVVASEGSQCDPVEELESYKKMPQVLVTSDPLRWWQEHGASFTRIKKLAHRYLPIPIQRPKGSKVNAETVRYLRTHMDKETLTRLLFAHENSDRL